MQIGLGLTIPEIATRGSQPYAGYSLALDFKNGVYRSGNTVFRDASQLPGYTYTRAGSKYELSAAGVPTAFIANAPAIVPGVGYWARGAFTNLMLQSNDTSNASWVKAASTCVAGQTGPDGTASATLETRTSTLAYVYQSAPPKAASPVQYTFGVAVKASIGTRFIVTLQSASAQRANGVFDLNVGTVVGTSVVGAWTGASATITPMGNGWFYCTLTATTDSLTTIVAYRSFFTSTTAIAVDSVDTATNSAGYTAFNQLVTGPIPGPMIATTTATATVNGDGMQFSQPIPVDEDFVIWAMVSMQTLAAVVETAFSLVPTGGLVSEMTAYRSAGSGIVAQVTTASVTTFIGGNTTQTTPGRVVNLIRHRGGKFQNWVKNAAGSIGTGTDTATAYPATLAALDIGHRETGIPANAPIEFIGYKRGTFSDTDLTNLLTAA